VTDLTRKVSRRVAIDGEPRPIIVTLHPDGTIDFREGRRSGFRVPLASVYRWAAIRAAEQICAERRKARALKKGSK